jgi:hypothetical protein
MLPQESGKDLRKDVRDDYMTARERG